MNKLELVIHTSAHNHRDTHVRDTIRDKVTIRKYGMDLFVYFLLYYFSSPRLICSYTYAIVFIISPSRCKTRYVLTLRKIIILFAGQRHFLKLRVSLGIIAEKERKSCAILLAHPWIPRNVTSSFLPGSAVRA